MFSTPLLAFPEEWLIKVQHPPTLVFGEGCIDDLCLNLFRSPIKPIQNVWVGVLHPFPGIKELAGDVLWHRPGLWFVQQSLISFSCTILKTRLHTMLKTLVYTHTHLKTLAYTQKH